MAYDMDMTKETEKKQLLPEGWREFEIINCVEEISKAGNMMFKFTIVDTELKQEEEIYAIAIPKKRWFLKQILTACGVEAGKKGIYKWDIPDVLNKSIMARVEHEDQEWINRNNQSVVSKRARIREVKSMEI